MYVNQKYYLLPQSVNISPKKSGIWPCNVMRCGLLWATNRTNSGFGLSLMSEHAKLLGSLSVTVVARVLERFGSLCYPSTVNAPSATPIFGKLMSKCYRARVRRTVGKETGHTSYIERFNNTVRQRVGRLVRVYVILFQKAEQSYWCSLELCASL